MRFLTGSLQEDHLQGLPSMAADTQQATRAGLFPLSRSPRPGREAGGEGSGGKAASGTTAAAVTVSLGAQE